MTRLPRDVLLRRQLLDVDEECEGKISDYEEKFIGDICREHPDIKLSKNQRKVAEKILYDYPDEGEALGCRSSD
tara:strand:- start:582 stop:803 length:222 start_codon:yes stop_codon:yes gene_type:complete